MSTPNRKRLSEVLTDAQALQRIWQTTKAADDLKPLPAGEYRCRVLDGELFKSKGNTPGYKLTLEVVDGDHAGRRLWCDFWLTEAAMPITLRDLGKLGITELTQLERPLPPGILLDCRVVVHRNDGGDEFNTVKAIAAAGVEKADPFAPPEDDDGQADDDEDAAAADEASKPKGPAGPTAGKKPLTRGNTSSGPYGAGDRR